MQPVMRTVRKNGVTIRFPWTEDTDSHAGERTGSE